MNKNIKNTITALLLIALAVCLILWKMNVILLPATFAGVGTWGIIISIIMIVVIVNSIIDLSFGGIFFPAAIICIIFDEALGITAITPWIVLIAALLLTIACDKLFPGSHRWFWHNHRNDDVNININLSDNDDDSVVEKSNDTGDQGFVLHQITMGSSTKYVSSKNLRRAKLNCSFGELTVFFDKAIAAEDTVVIDCSVSFGDLVLFLPREWTVVNHTSCSFADCNDIASGIPGEGNVTCIINGSASFGEIKIQKI